MLLLWHENLNVTHLTLKKVTRLKFQVGNQMGNFLC